MKEYQLNKPVLFLVFNRPETTKKVFTAIRNAKPPRLYIASDGPRPSVISDREACAEVRALIMDHIDWECEVKTLLREENLGCRLAVSSAIDWFFENEEDGIILEDDCLPHPDFFRFCREMLDQYRNTPQVMMIAGSNYEQFYNENGTCYFSRYPRIWGWASWRRAWSLYDLNIIEDASLPRIISERSCCRAEEKTWKRILKMLKQGRINTWDFQMNFTMFMNDMLTLCPNDNYIRNIGQSIGTNQLYNRSSFNLRDISLNGQYNKPSRPSQLTADSELDKAFYWKSYHTSLYARIKAKLIQILNI